MKSGKVFILILLVSVLLVACGSVSAPPADDTAALATMVAATMQAVLDNPDAAVATQTPAEGGDAPAPAAPKAELVAPTAAPQPVAPAALTVAYVKNGNVHVWTEGGSSTALTNSGDVRNLVVSSDGQLVAYVRENPSIPFVFELWAVNTSLPADARLLVSHTEMDALKSSGQYASADGLDFDLIEFRPGTHDLYYSTTPRFMGPGYAPSYDLRIVNTDTLAKSTLFDFGQAGTFKFSPDGTQVVLSSPDHIDLVNADGSNLRANVLTYPQVSTYAGYQYRPNPIWASDSRSLRVAIPPEDPLADPTSPTTLWFLPVDGSTAVQISSISAIPFDWPDHAFSPDLNTIAYMRSYGEPTENLRELHVAYADGSGDIVYTAGPSLQFIGWSPDGTRFLYASNLIADSGLYLASISGQVTLIASLHQTMQKLNWVDGSRLIFIYDYAGKIELRISDQDGQNHAFIDSLTDSLASYDFTP